MSTKNTNTNNNDIVSKVIEAGTEEQMVQNNKSFVYIGKTLGKTKKCMSFFDNSLRCLNFASAVTLLDTQLNDGEDCPDLIIIDLPFDKFELVNFITFLHSKKWSYDVPVIYNESALKGNHLKELSSLRLVDDIVNVESYCTQLQQKALFLKKAKSFLLNPSPLKAVSPIKQFRKDTSYGINYFIKRTIDISLASAAIILLLPVFLLIVIMIKLDSKGAVIYKSKRAGKGFKIFNFYKFRTMIPGADKKVSEMLNSDQNLYAGNGEKSAFLKVKDDPRVTKFGSFLRNTSLDELPQLFNVVKGDMSLVGNRPLPLYEAVSLTTDDWAERFMAPAGITGLWQVKKRGQKEMSTEERMDLDINYARNHNLVRDMWIMASTPSALFQKANV